MNRVVLRLLVSLLLVTACAFAQRDLSTISGTVTDTSGGVVPNAKVTITEQATGLVYETVTNAAGEFVRPALKPSVYMVTISAAGFRQSQQKDIPISAGDRTAINITLTIGDVGQTVEVQASAPILQTETTQVGAALNSKSMSD